MTYALPSFDTADIAAPAGGYVFPDYQVADLTYPSNARVVT